MRTIVAAVVEEDGIEASNAPSLNFGDLCLRLLFARASIFGLTLDMKSGAPWQASLFIWEGGCPPFSSDIFNFSFRFNAGTKREIVRSVVENVDLKADS